MGKFDIMYVGVSVYRWFCIFIADKMTLIKMVGDNTREGLVHDGIFQNLLNLTHLDLVNVAEIWQEKLSGFIDGTFSRFWCFVSMIVDILHWSIFIRVTVTIIQHRVRYCLGAETGDKLLPVAIMTQFSDASMCHRALRSSTSKEIDELVR